MHLTRNLLLAKVIRNLSDNVLNKKIERHKELAPFRNRIWFRNGANLTKLISLRPSARAPTRLIPTVAVSEGMKAEEGITRRKPRGSRFVGALHHEDVNSSAIPQC